MGEGWVEVEIEKSNCAAPLSPVFTVFAIFCRKKKQNKPKQKKREKNDSEKNHETKSPANKTKGIRGSSLETGRTSRLMISVRLS